MRLPILLIICLPAFGQISVPAPASTVNASALPSIVTGIGGSWTRGNAQRYAGTILVGIHVGSGNWYSWSTISTPVVTSHVSAPVSSTISTGGAWIAAQSADGKLGLLTIMQIGFSTVQATSTTAPTISGSLGLVYKISPNNWILLYAQAQNPNAANNAMVFQPGIQFVHGFGAH